jgi:hypothetical protein
MQPITMILEIDRLTPPNERMMLKAIDKLMIIRHKRDEDISVNNTAFKEMSHP